jgi:hypothetical protein
MSKEVIAAADVSRHVREINALVDKLAKAESKIEHIKIN